jgi:pimeloyl-ACP methyl ester carboxylesterase
MRQRHRRRRAAVCSAAAEPDEVDIPGWLDALLWVLAVLVGSSIGGLLAWWDPLSFYS